MQTLVGSPLQSVMATGSFSFLLLFACLFVSHSKNSFCQKFSFLSFLFNNTASFINCSAFSSHFLNFFLFIVSFVFFDFILFKVDFHYFIIYFLYIIFVLFVSYAFRMNDCKKVCL
jgi:hypothetical protein